MPEQSRISVLIADDHPVFRQGLKSALGAIDDIEIVAVTDDGANTLDTIRKLQPTVALIDLNLPTMSGIDIIARLQAERVDTRVVIFSAQDSPAVAYDCIEAGASAFVSKTAEPEVLFEAVRAAARGETRLPSTVQHDLVAQIQTRRAPAPVLSARERAILELVADGHSAPDIAAQLYLGTSTVKTHLLSLYAKLGVTDRAAAVAKAMRLGMLQ